MADQTKRTSKTKTLYAKCLDTYVSSLNYNVSTMESVEQLRYLPQGVLIDLYYTMAQREFLHDMLLEQLSDLEIFERLLRFDPARQKLFRCMSILIGNKKPLADKLQKNFNGRYAYVEKHDKMAAQKPPPPSPATTATATTTTTTTTTTTPTTSKSSSTIKAAEKDNEINSAKDLDSLDFDETEIQPYLSHDVVDFALRLGSFLCEAGWMAESIKVLSCVAKQLERIKEAEHKSPVVQLDCLQRLLHSQHALGDIKASERTFAAINNLFQSVPAESLPKSLLANTYTQFSAMYFVRSQYDDSHMWSVMAMQYIEDNTPERIAIDVLRQAAKACVVKRDFQRANVLICHATKRASKVFGRKHQKYADALHDYGFFLLNVDAVYMSVSIYKEALDIKSSIFGNRNLHVALAHEDLSYAYYVHEYSTGNFTLARENVEKAIDIMKEIVPHDHLRLASAKRVKALLLEEIALDKIAEGMNEDGLLKQSEELHKFALNLSLKLFGEANVQTAKHYGNLGRLYQTMKRYEEAESMHLKAIKIKTDILGPQDYEVGLSIGHLASLYNYQMKKYHQAERLYLRSIEISLRLFGRSYSGLEYDYLGLCHVYESRREFEKYLKYASILENWQVLRLQNVNMNRCIYPAELDDCSLQDIKYRFFNMGNLNLTACN